MLTGFPRMQLLRPRLATGPQARPPRRERPAQARRPGGVGRHAVSWRWRRRGQAVQAPGGSEEGAPARRGRALGCSGGGEVAEARLHMVSERVHIPWCCQGQRPRLFRHGSPCRVCVARDAAEWWMPHAGADSQVWHCI